MKTLTVVPAYGRDYKTEDEVIEAWAKGMDFQIQDISSRWNGSYVSNKDDLAGTTVKIRYNKLADFVMVEY